MLAELYIENFAIIDKIHINFDYGLSIITGETGSGKSIVIKALEILSGHRISRDLIGKYGQKSVVEGIFHIDSALEREFQDKFGISVSEGELILTREFNTEGKSIARINGRISNISVIKEISEGILDIHGQNQNQSLLKKENYLNLIDGFMNKKVLNHKNDLKEGLKQQRNLLNKLESLNIDEKEKDREIDLLNFQLEEIDQIDYTNLNEKKLNEEFELLTKAQEIKLALSKIQTIFQTENYMEMDMVSGISKAISYFNEYEDLNEDTKNIGEGLYGLQTMIQDIYHDIDILQNSVEINDQRIEELNAIIQHIYNLKRKYGDSIPEILEYRERIDQRLQELEHIEENLRQIHANLQKIEEENEYHATVLSEERKKIAQKLEGDIIKSLQSLNMPHTKFTINFSKKEKIDINGYDSINFYISTNLGEPLKEMDQVASGGEISRIMLGFKSILAEYDSIETLIFDEIDTGISGRTAQIVGEKLLEIAKKHQVLVISHLPQLAALGNSHYKIYKTMSEDSTHSKIERIPDQGRVKELARLIAGVNITDITLNQAEEMLEQAKKLKENL